MLLELKVKNVLGYSYTMNFESGSRNRNIVKIDNISLFNTFQVTGSGYSQIYGAISVLKSLNTPTFRLYCKKIKTEASIFIKFIQLDPATSEYTTYSYFIQMCKSGIVKEIVNEQALMPIHPLDSAYASSIPKSITSYIENFLIYDLKDPLNISSIEEVFKQSIALVQFKEFVNIIMKLGGFPILSIEKNDSSELLVYREKGVASNFDDESVNFKTLAYISWALFIVLIKSGPIILHNLDKALTYYSINKIIELFGNVSNLKFNSAQLLFSADATTFGLFPEQLLEVQDSNGISWCSWQTF